MDSTSPLRSAAVRRYQRAILVLSIFVFGLLAWGLMLLSEWHALDAQHRHRAPTKAEIVEHLVSSAQGGFDTHPDPDVARIMQPGLDGKIGWKSNRFGLRERDFEIEKPKDTVRVVLLGDSFVYGYGVREEERLGVHLEQLLKEHAPSPTPSIEVLHIGIGSWNVRSECAFLRRALHWIEPDLVLHVLVPNDLDDTVDARGFGAFANFSSQVRERANGITHIALSIDLGSELHTWLPYGLDHESQTRFATSRQLIEDLEARVRARGGEYVLVLNWFSAPMVGRRLFAPDRTPRSILDIPSRFAVDPTMRVSATDGHWSPKAHRLLASALYGCIAERELLPMLKLARVAEHAREYATLHQEGMQEALTEVPAAARHALLAAFASRLTLPIGPETPVQQVYAGLDKEGHLAPYFAAVLATRGGRKLRLHAQGLQRSELAGATLEVQADECSLGRIPCGDGEDVEIELEIPEALRDRSVLAIRLIASDYVYLRNLRTPAVLLLRELSIVP